MNLKRALKGTALEVPARKLRDALIRTHGAHGPATRETSHANLRVLACSTYPTGLTEHPSIFFFTTHKCASTFAARVLAEIEQIGPRAHYDYAGAIWGLGNALPGENPYSLMKSEYHHLFFPYGEVYGPMRHPISVENPDDYRMIFFLRDPRDVVVSAYYSFGFSHGIPKNSKSREIFLQRRAQIQDEGIDRYALRAASEWLIPIYREYQALRQLAGKSLLIRYDDYTTDPYEAICRILEFCDARADTARVAALAQTASPISAERGNDTELRHKRSGRSGQFKTELDAGTCARLNQIFSEQLSTWGFPT